MKIILGWETCANLIVKYELQILLNQIINYNIAHTMASKLPKLREYYDRVYKKVRGDPYDVKLGPEVARYRSIALQEQQRILANNQPQYFQEVAFYAEKFTNLEQLIKDQVSNKISSADYSSKARQLFSSYPNQSNQLPPTNSQYNSNQQTPQPSPASYLRNSTLNRGDSFGPIDSQRRSGVSPQRQALDQFFIDKQSKISNKMSPFGSVLDRPSNVSPSAFRKKAQNQDELSRLRTQNSQLLSNLSQIRPGNMDDENRRKLQQRRSQNNRSIRALQQQYSQLSRDNYRLRSQRSGSAVTSRYEGDDYLYSPYTFSIRSNDIHQINMRNLNDEGYQYQFTEMEPSVKEVRQERPVKVKQQHVIHKTVGYEYDTYTEQDYENQNKLDNNYSIFDANKSAYSENGDFSSTREGVTSYKTAVRNKNLFFKTKGLLVRNDDIQIGVKRWQADAQNVVKVIFYFHNKRPDTKYVRTNYQYEQDYYQIKVIETTKMLQSFSQGRQVVEVRLRGNQPGFNSLINFNVYIGSDTYKLWLPAMFMKISRSGPGRQSSGNQEGLTVRPSKSFQSPSQASRVIENLNMINNNQAQFWVDSVKGSGPVRMTWKSGDSLKIRADKKWVNYFGYLMCDTS